MRRILAFILVMVLAGATIGLTACNNRDKDTIVVWAYDAAYTAAEEAVKLYQKDNPNTKFEVVELAQDDLVQKFRIALASGSSANLPDIIYEEDYNTLKKHLKQGGCFALLHSQKTLTRQAAHPELKAQRLLAKLRQ